MKYAAIFWTAEKVFALLLTRFCSFSDRQDGKRYAGYFVLRFMPSICVVLVIFGATLHGVCESDAAACDVCIVSG